MMKRMLFPLMAMYVSIMLFSCKKTDLSAKEKPEFDPGSTTGTLKDAADFPIGVGIGYNMFKNNAAYAEVVKREFDNVTFEYQMKHAAIVQNNGTKNYAATDELVNLASAAGLQIYGHTLAWHQNNNGDFLRSFGAAPPPSATDLYAAFNGNFESGTGNSFPGWARLAGDGGAAAYDVETAGNPQGARSFKVTVNTLGSNPWSIQSLGSNWTAVTGRQYQVKLFAKGIGQIKLVNQNTAYAETTINVNNTWAEYTWNYTAGETSPQFKLQFPQTGTFWIDDIRIVEAPAAPPGNAAVAVKVDSVLKDWIQGMVTRYKDKVKAWDVVNEPYTDGTPAIRTGAGTTGGTYYWAQYLGRGYIAKAFNYAKQIDPTAELFLNDYNLESNSAKLDSIIALAAELKAQNAGITGIGTQMHISVNTDHGGIERMFQKLAATGLKVKITELDVRVSSLLGIGFNTLDTTFKYQAAMYKFVVESYMRNIPPAQRYGVTVWNVGDTDSWIVVGPPAVVEYPTLFDKDYKKKPAYAGFMQALKQQ
ncbi:MAG: endo-1,4-beta-xylanase [Chitinophagaceae bacterium]|nr:endo-1,4-beta-xylanase [Chitinophagaceae bacterium]